ncbi:SPOR domain-containing protein [Glaciecola sp. SC05]|uniref:SPOR domain-containing protein n=1 Tax=Glaciecola sp. SC05 TaxID=1987355 RepID=UPI0035285094
MCSYLSACLLTDAFKTEMIENHNKQSQLSEIEQERLELSDEKSELTKKIQELERRYTLKEIEDNIEDFKALRPSITRLIELESDLAFVTEFLRNKEKPVSFSANQPLGDTLGSLPELSDIVEQQQTQTLLTKNNGNVEPGFDTPQQSSPNVSVMAATPITAPIIKSTTSAIVATDSKFSNFEGTSSNLVVAATTTAPEMDTKFSQAQGPHQGSTESSGSNGSTLRPITFQGNTMNGRSSSEIVANIKDKALPLNLPTDCQASPSGGRYSVHLASYSNEKNAKAGWQSLASKYANVLCALTPKLASVQVKGTPYLSLRLGPIDNKAMAQQICKTIQAKGDYCASAPYEGASL